MDANHAAMKWIGRLWSAAAALKTGEGGCIASPSTLSPLFFLLYHSSPQTLQKP
jgi:hypothetical protein